MSPHWQALVAAAALCLAITGCAARGSKGHSHRHSGESDSCSCSEEESSGSGSSGSSSQESRPTAAGGGNTAAPGAGSSTVAGDKDEGGDSDEVDITFTSPNETSTRPPPPPPHAANTAQPEQMLSTVFRPNQSRPIQAVKLTLGNLANDATTYGSFAVFLLDQKMPHVVSDFVNQAFGKTGLRDPQGLLTNHSSGFENLTLFDVFPQYISCKKLNAKKLEKMLKKDYVSPTTGMWSALDTDWTAPQGSGSHSHGKSDERPPPGEPVTSVYGSGAGERCGVVSVLRNSGAFFVSTDKRELKGARHRDFAIIDAGDVLFLQAMQKSFCEYTYIINVTNGNMKKGKKDKKNKKGNKGKKARKGKALRRVKRWGFDGGGGGLGFTDLTMM